MPPNLKYFGGYSSWKDADNNKYTPPSFPEGIEYIGGLGYNDHPTNTAYTVPSTVKCLRSTFGGWSSLESIEIPEGATNIYAICNWCSVLTNVVFQNGCPGLKEIGYEAFNYCKKLQSITIPNGVETIGESAFSGCDVLSSVTFPSGLKTIGYGAFSSCSSFTRFDVPEGVTTVGDYACAFIDNITEITLPSTLTQIGVSLCCVQRSGKVTSIKCYATTPPVCKNRYGSQGDDVFGGLPSNCYIYVPSSSVYSYKRTTGWAKYASQIRSL